MNSFPRIPVDEGDFTAVVALIISLVGAILGGPLGMRFHRRVDREGLWPLQLTHTP